MKIMSSARVVVVHADPAQRGSLCSALAQLGMPKTLPAQNPEEARCLADSEPVDLCIVDAQSLSLSAPGATHGFPPNPFDPSQTPGILLSPCTSRETVRAAAGSGYHVVLAAPVAPRLLYRRIGSLLQKVRRANRANALNVAAQAAVREAEIRDA